MKSIYLLTITLVLSAGCTFKGEINDKRPDDTSNPNKQTDSKSSEVLPFGGVDIYSFQESTGGEIKRSISILEGESGQLLLEEPIYLPQGNVSISMNFKNAQGSSYKIDLASVVNVEGKSSGLLTPLEGSGENDVDYSLDSNNLDPTASSTIQLQATSLADSSQTIYVEGEIFKSPPDIAINPVSPASSAGRDQSKDIYSEAGTFYYLFDLVVHNSQPFAIEVDVPTVLAGNFLVRKYFDVEIPNQAARNIDPKKCGGAVSISREFRENRLSTLGLYLVPSDVKSIKDVSEYILENSHAFTLDKNETKVFSVNVEGRSDLEIAGKIFGGEKQQSKRIVSGCTPKKSWVDDGRDWQNRFGEREPVKILGGYYIYYGEPQHSNVNLRRGISRVFLDFNKPQNGTFTVRPTGNYENSILNITPASLFNQRLLYTNGVE